MPVARLAICYERLDHRRQVVGGRRAIEWPRAREPGVGQPSLASDSGAEVGHVYRPPVHLDGNASAVAQDGTVDGSHPSRAEDEAGNGYPEPSAHMLFDPGIDVFTANRAEHGPLDAPHKFVIQTDLVTHSCKNLLPLAAVL